MDDFITTIIQILTNLRRDAITIISLSSSLLTFPTSFEHHLDRPAGPDKDCNRGPTGGHRAADQGHDPPVHLQGDLPHPGRHPGQH